ncbi:hypothetical protein DP120_00250 [Planococcus halotolerans]|uniref:Uncharacterized protein n=1 Tax=Planococcus halotolerans TaxID=2233542 RepID=A0A365L663_9BACL|nr:hypothetical protein DP120_00250 [Planococcus halotolerans]
MVNPEAAALGFFVWGGFVWSGLGALSDGVVLVSYSWRLVSYRLFMLTYSDGLLTYSAFYVTCRVYMRVASKEKCIQMESSPLSADCPVGGASAAARFWVIVSCLAWVKLMLSYSWRIVSYNWRLVSYRLFLLTYSVGLLTYSAFYVTCRIFLRVASGEKCIQTESSPLPADCPVGGASPVARFLPIVG